MVVVVVVPDVVVVVVVPDVVVVVVVPDVVVVDVSVLFLQPPTTMRRVMIEMHTNNFTKFLADI
ncbi:MAG: hypothetical protein NTX46_00565 [Chloroflexi bacterium]|nr:hypothetical protein [Chloroflexota bacterium]